MRFRMENEEATVAISLTNSKLGGLIPSLNLPPIVTCRKNAPCARLCYARKGNFRYDTVKKSHRENYEAYQENPVLFFRTIRAFLNNGLVIYKYFRWHSAGDIADSFYLYEMIKTAQECPQTNFLAFTKKYELVNAYIKRHGDDPRKVFPKNLVIAYSMWDKNYKIDNPYNLPVTWVKFKKNELNPDIPETAIPCKGKCYKCQACWHLQQGESIVFKQH